MNKIMCVISLGKPHHTVVMNEESKGEAFICYLTQLFNKDPKDIQLTFKASVGCMRATNIEKLNWTS